MFTINHFIWLAICAVLIAGSLLLLRRYKPTMNQVLTVACVCAAISELVKTAAEIEILPTASGAYTIFIDPQYIPLHLCSVQVVFIFLVRFMKKGSARDALLAFMYPTCAFLPVLALFIPTVFSATDVADAFTAVMPYQYFLYHAMLVVLGVYIASSGCVKFEYKHILSTVCILIGLLYLSIYLNSALASVDYSSGSPVVENVTNFFFSYGLPASMNLFTITEKWQWLAYMAFVIILGLILITLSYLPFILYRRKKERAPSDSFGEGA